MRIHRAPRRVPASSTRPESALAPLRRTPGKTHLPPALCGPKIPVGAGHACGQIGRAKICNFVATLLEHKRLRKFVSTPGASGRSYRVRPNEIYQGYH
ncbi:hypothetical protein PAHAL_2G063200 [Panicum hallii]|uniref:Uncharacterized protein n=1 Tax=Panicum hallii TaxID=206008 RepID=A0A2T8KN71_9POAL|nr:hypothetical protein PAHAL_2G063200 [Panicum hallii]